MNWQHVLNKCVQFEAFIILVNRDWALIFFVNREWALIFFVNREQYPLCMTLNAVFWAEYDVYSVIIVYHQHEYWFYSSLYHDV